GSIGTLNDIWHGYSLMSGVDTVRHAISGFEKIEAGQVSKLDPDHASPGMGEENLKRISSVPRDGGSWFDLFRLGKEDLLTPGMKSLVERKKFGSYPDIYGRMAWDEPARTIKRECSHIGNGRYAHPEQDRLCTVREMATLQGYPVTYKFQGSLSNRYRHIGDAVPPLISRQLAAACQWMLLGRKPKISDFILEGTSLSADDIVVGSSQHGLNMEIEFSEAQV
ncbi:DNA cytosine methyltransferase, partial [Streptomyces heliomycini]